MQGFLPRGDLTRRGHCGPACQPSRAQGPEKSVRGRLLDTLVAFRDAALRSGKVTASLVFYADTSFYAAVSETQRNPLVSRRLPEASVPVNLWRGRSPSTSSAREQSPDVRLACSAGAGRPRICAGDWPGRLGSCVYLTYLPVTFSFGSVPILLPLCQGGRDWGRSVNP